METKSIQIPAKLHKTLSRELLRNDDMKTFAELISYYRTMTIQYLKKLELERSSK
jgi:hypothetical protein